MSEFHIEVVRLGEICTHPNADNLEITTVHNGYPCIIRKGSMKEGDLAVYIPVDTVLPNTPAFSFLKESERKHLRAKKLRGVFSMGLLIPAEEGMVEGQDVVDILGISRYEPPEPVLINSENESPPPWHFPCYTDIEGLRRYGSVLTSGEEVVITEKLHGANARFAHDGTRLWVGSRTCVKKRNEANLWWKVAIDLNMEEILAKEPSKIFFGEVYGQVQDLKYGIKGSKFMAFDVFDTKIGRYMDNDDAYSLVTELGLTWAPILFRGPWSDDLKMLSEGNSTLADHVREGFVVKPIKERLDPAIGRVILKLHGEGFLTRK